MPGRRGARSGRGWDAAPPRAGATGGSRSGRRRRGGPLAAGWSEDAEAGWPEGALPASGAPRRAAYPPDPADFSDSADSADPTSAPGAADPPDPTDLPGARAPEPAPQRAEAEVAREICLRQLAVRPRTRAELAAALRRKGISPETTAEVLDRYDEVGIIDDAAFARAWVTSRHHGRGLARRALANELRQRGVDVDAAGAALEELDPETEAATARALAERRLRTATGPPEAVFRKVTGMLARKGYPAGVAIRAVKEAMAARDAEAAAFTEQIDPDALAEAMEPEG
ncbi:regulatory protein RecX [Rhizomonospora bruguierae]|uniref:regulatory protein RecX n=1 Tax=Rhizomonospora bruguierae TaxID=1581705 RepID=UPI001BCE0E62|nr:regulatory protein RecX [Micromonospora sp. NBRC 107566]